MVENSDVEKSALEAEAKGSSIEERTENSVEGGGMVAILVLLGPPAAPITVGELP